MSQRVEISKVSCNLEQARFRLQSKLLQKVVCAQFVIAFTTTVTAEPAQTQGEERGQLCLPAMLSQHLQERHKHTNMHTHSLLRSRTAKE